MVDMVRLYGRHLRMAFEHSVANYSPIDRPGAFFQMSGKTFPTGKGSLID